MLPWRVKVEAFFHLTPNISYPLMIVVSALMLPVMIVRFYMGWFQMLMIDLPLIAASFWSISAFYVIAHRELFPKTWKRAFLFLPALMAAGVALTIINTRAVLEALIGYQTSFARTPKYAIGGTQKVKLENVQYRRRSGWLPYAELAAGHVLPGDGGLRDRILQLPGDSVPAAVRRRLFLGRLHHAVGRISGQARLAAPAGTGCGRRTGESCLVRRAILARPASSSAASQRSSHRLASSRGSSSLRCMASKDSSATHFARAK